MRILERDVLRELLVQWAKGTLDERSVHEQAEVLLEEYGCPEFDESDARSIAIEVLTQLDILNHQLITIEDIPAILRFLDTPAGHERDGWARWKRYGDRIDYDQRAIELKDNPYYST